MNCTKALKRFLESVNLAVHRVRVAADEWSGAIIAVSVNDGNVERTKINESKIKGGRKMTEPYAVFESDGDLLLVRRPRDTQGNFVVSNWYAVVVDDTVLIEGETYKGKRLFEMPADTPFFKEDGSDLGTLANIEKYQNA